MRKKRAARPLAALTLLLLPLLTGCVNWDAPMTGNGSEEQIVGQWTDATFTEQGFAQIAGYEHLGLGFITDSVQTKREVAAPYGGNVALMDNLLQAANHGVSFSVMFSEEESASAAAESARDKISGDATASGVIELTWGDTQAESETAASATFSYGARLGSSVAQVNAVIRADQLDNTCRVLWIEYAPDAADEQSGALLSELEDYYHFTLPQGFADKTETNK